jgi:hypothetical protein
MEGDMPDEGEEDFDFDTPPLPGTPVFVEVLALGCGGYRDYFGDYDCRHNYTWLCEDCPILNAPTRIESDPDDAEGSEID